MRIHARDGVSAMFKRCWGCESDVWGCKWTSPAARKGLGLLPGHCFAPRETLLVGFLPALAEVREFLLGCGGNVICDGGFSHIDLWRLSDSYLRVGIHHAWCWLLTSMCVIWSHLWRILLRLEVDYFGMVFGAYFGTIVDGEMFWNYCSKVRSNIPLRLTFNSKTSGGHLRHVDRLWRRPMPWKSLRQKVSHAPHGPRAGAAQSSLSTPPIHVSSPRTLCPTFSPSIHLWQTVRELLRFLLSLLNPGTAPPSLRFLHLQFSMALRLLPTLLVLCTLLLAFAQLNIAIEVVSAVYEVRN